MFHNGVEHDVFFALDLNEFVKDCDALICLHIGGGKAIIDHLEVFLTKFFDFARLIRKAQLLFQGVEIAGGHFAIGGAGDEAAGDGDDEDETDNVFHDAFSFIDVVVNKRVVMKASAL